MCPIWPVHWILLYLMVMYPVWLVTCQAVKAAGDWSLQFSPSLLHQLEEGETRQVYFTAGDLTTSDVQRGVATVVVGDPSIAFLASAQEFTLKTEPVNDSHWSSAFNLTGNFLGYTNVKLRLTHKIGNESVLVRESNELSVSVVRKRALLDKAFTASVVVLVSIMFVSFGCALDVAMLKRAIVRPVGPLIGLLCHFFLLPIACWGLGLLLFPDSVPLRLGLFFAGVSPAGGASNVWTVALGGNLNLSVTMTAISTLASFVMIPLWVLTLGQTIFTTGSVGLPYTRLLRSGVSMFMPLAIGYGLQLYCKKVANLMVRILKPFSTLLIVFIVVFAIVTNLYLFKLFTWQILVGGLSLPVVGYLLGWAMSTVLRQSGEDVIAISIETAVQNTGIAIFLLQFCLSQPEADLTTVGPVAVALMTPLPLLLVYLVGKVTGKKGSGAISGTPPMTKVPTHDPELCIISGYSPTTPVLIDPKS